MRRVCLTAAFPSPLALTWPLTLWRTHLFCLMMPLLPPAMCTPRRTLARRYYLVSKWHNEKSFLLVFSSGKTPNLFFLETKCVWGRTVKIKNNSVLLPRSMATLPDREREGCWTVCVPFETLLINQGGNKMFIFIFHIPDTRTCSKKISLYLSNFNATKAEKKWWPWFC